MEAKERLEKNLRISFEERKYYLATIGPVFLVMPLNCLVPIGAGPMRDRALVMVMV